MTQYALYALALLLGGVSAPWASSRWMARVSRRCFPASAHWKARVVAFDAVLGAMIVSLVSGIAWVWLDPFTAVLHAAIGTGALVVGIWWSLDEIDDRVDLVGAVGRAKQDAELLEAARQGSAIRWAMGYGGSARVVGGGIATGLVYLGAVLG